MEDVRGFKVIDVYAEHKVEEINIEDVVFQEDSGEEVNIEGEYEEVNVGGADEQSEIDPNYNMGNEDGEEDEKDDIYELNLGANVGVNWTTVLPNAITEQPSKLDDISDNDSCDSICFILHLIVMLKLIWKGFQLLRKPENLKQG